MFSLMTAMFILNDCNVHDGDENDSNVNDFDGSHSDLDPRVEPDKGFPVFLLLLLQRVCQDHCRQNCSTMSSTSSIRKPTVHAESALMIMIIPNLFVNMLSWLRREFSLVRISFLGTEFATI